MDGEPMYAAMLQAVQDLTRQLGGVTRAEQEARDTLRTALEAQFTALRHDNYGSILTLSSEVVALQKSFETSNTASTTWRAAQDTARANGTFFYRLIAVGFVVVSFAWLVLSIAVLMLAIRWLSV